MQTLITSAASSLLTFKPKSSHQKITPRTSSLAVVTRRDLFLMSAAALCTGYPPPAMGTAAAEYPIKLEGVVKRVVTRPRKSRSREEKEGEEEVLVIEGIEFDRGIPVKFDVYVNDDDDDGPAAAEFAGSLVNVPHSGRTRLMKTCLRLGITDLLEDVGADDDDSIVVTLVPKTGAGLISIANIGIQLLS